MMAGLLRGHRRDCAAHGTTPTVPRDTSAMYQRLSLRHLRFPAQTAPGTQDRSRRTYAEYVEGARKKCVTVWRPAATVRRPAATVPPSRYCDQRSRCCGHGTASSGYGAGVTVLRPAVTVLRSRYCGQWPRCSGHGTATAAMVLLPAGTSSRTPAPHAHGAGSSCNGTAAGTAHEPRQQQRPRSKRRRPTSAELRGGLRR
jgi:hypothetical protein